MKLITVVSLFIVIAFFSCNNQPKTDAAKSCCKNNKADESSMEIPDESIFNLTSLWIKQNNDTMQLRQLRGKITVAAMVFTNCESACPRIVADMQRIESSLTEKERKQISFLLISMDPERDTPARMREFAAEHQLNANWTLISAKEDATMEMANVLGVRVKKLEGGGFDHSNTIHVINRNGVILHQQIGFAEEQNETLQAIRSVF